MSEVPYVRSAIHRSNYLRSCGIVWSLRPGEQRVRGLKKWQHPGLPAEITVSTAWL